MKSPFWVNNIYGIGVWLKKFTFYPTWLPLCNYIEHGIILSDDVPKHEKETIAPLMFRHSPIKVETHKKISNKSIHCIISPFAFYRTSNKIQKKYKAKGTLYFPCHSTELVDDLTNWDSFIDDLNKIPEKYKPIDICLHHTDVVKGLDKIFISKGYKVFSAGNSTSQKFIEDFYDILKNYTFTMSNFIGSYTFYSVEMNIPFSLYGEEPKFFNKGDENIEMGEYTSYKKDSRRLIAQDLFQGFHSNINEKQKEFVDFQLGKTESISRIKASLLLYRALIIYSFKHPKILKEIFMNLLSKVKYVIWTRTSKKVFFPIMFFAKKILLRRQDKDYALTKTGCVSLKELYKLKYKAVKETSILFGKEVYKTDSFWYLHSLNELFLDEVYRFKSDKKEPLILDCGSNIGLSTIYFKRLFPSAKITAFEADASICELMKKNMSSFNLADVEVVNKAIWIENTMLNFSASGNLGGSLTHNKLGQEVSENNSLPVSAIRLYDLLDKEIDFLKIDIEGAEIEVLKDCEDRLKNVVNIFVEYHSNPNDKQELDAVLSILTNAGFRYDIKEAWNNLPYPYFRENYNPCFDLQLNIFGYRIT